MPRTTPDAPEKLDFTEVEAEVGRLTAAAAQLSAQGAPVWVPLSCLSLDSREAVAAAIPGARLRLRLMRWKADALGWAPAPPAAGQPALL